MDKCISTCRNLKYVCADCGRIICKMTDVTDLKYENLPSRPWISVADALPSDEIYS